MIATAHTDPVRSLGSAGTMWAMCHDPTQPISNPVTGQALATIPACLHDLVLARPDDGFRTKLRVARRVARWRPYDYVLTAGWGPLGPSGLNDHRAPGPIQVEAGDEWTWASRLPPCAISPAAGPFTFRAYQASQASGVFWWDTPTNLVHAPGSTCRAGSPRSNRTRGGCSGGTSRPARRPPASRRTRPTRSTNGSNGPPAHGRTMHRDRYQRGGTYGIRAADGIESPIGRQADLITWATDAASWCSSPQLLADAARCGSPSAHREPGRRAG